MNEPDDDPTPRPFRVGPPFREDGLSPDTPTGEFDLRDVVHEIKRRKRSRKKEVFGLGALLTLVGGGSGTAGWKALSAHSNIAALEERVKTQGEELGRVRGQLDRARLKLERCCVGRDGTE